MNNKLFVVVLVALSLFSVGKLALAQGYEYGGYGSINNQVRSSSTADTELKDGMNTAKEWILSSETYRRGGSNLAFKDAVVTDSIPQKYIYTYTFDSMKQKYTGLSSTIWPTTTENTNAVTGMATSTAPRVTSQESTTDEKQFCTFCEGFKISFKGYTGKNIRMYSRYWQPTMMNGSNTGQTASNAAQTASQTAMAPSTKGLFSHTIIMTLLNRHVLSATIDDNWDEFHHRDISSIQGYNGSSNTY